MQLQPRTPEPFMPIPSPLVEAPRPAAVDEPIPGAGRALALLFLVYLFNYLDRTLIFILMGPIKAELALSELQLQLLGSTSFVLFYVTLGVPFGRLADRVSRTRMIAAGVALWSLASALTGVMHGFAGMFACRVVVGVGEATLGPAALSLLSDLFSPKRRATVSAAFSAAIPVGAGLALLLGGIVGARWGWRNAFLFCGLPGLLLAAFMLLLREPERGVAEGTRADTAEALGVTLRGLARVRGLAPTIAGYSLFAIASYGIQIWVPRFLMLKFQLPLATVGMYTGALVGACGLAGVIGAGALADALATYRRGGRLLFSAACALLCAASWIGVLWAGTIAQALVPFGVLCLAGMAWLGPAAADVQALAGPTRRGIAIGIYFFAVNLIGYGAAPPCMGKLADLLVAAKDPTLLRQVLLVCPAAAVLAAGVLYLASRRLDREG